MACKTLHLFCEALSGGAAWLVVEKKHHCIEN
jgi:hypothetical protein